MTSEGVYDFGKSDISTRLAALAESIQDYRDFFQAPPSDAVFFHRKVGGMFLLAQRFKAKIDVNGMVKERI